MTLSGDEWREVLMKGLQQILQQEGIEDFRSAYAFMTAQVAAKLGDDADMRELLSKAESVLLQREMARNQRVLRTAMQSVKTRNS
jgi:hypothetical protein